MKRIKSILTLLQLSIAIVVCAQESVQGVKISMEKGAPHDNAILELEVEPGENKGLLLPRVTTDPNDGGSSFKNALGNDETAKGMIIYADRTDNKKGVWYYDGEAFIRMSLPVGSIMMYGGSLTGKFDQNGVGINEYYGWALCNGYNGQSGSAGDVNIQQFLTDNGGMNSLPDLRGRFIVGASRNVGGPSNYSGENYTMNNSGGDHEITVETNNIPLHLHNVTVNNTDPSSVVRANQTMNVNFSHTHPFTYRTYFADKPCNRCDGEHVIEHFNGNTDGPNEIEIAAPTEPGSLTINGSLQIEGDAHEHTATITNDNNSYPNDPIDIRPPYYVLAYIIKIK